MSLAILIRENPSQLVRQLADPCHPSAIEKASDHQPKARSGERVIVDIIFDCRLSIFDG